MSKFAEEWAAARAEQFGAMLSPEGRRLLLAIAEHADAEGVCRASNWRLGTRARLTPAALHFQFGQLWALGLVRSAQGASTFRGVETIHRLQFVPVPHGAQALMPGVVYQGHSAALSAG
jgi:hypothetical protein